ncbi:sel1 repeat family protein [Micavibrio aeruginosavorus]|uniref:sel1 repeat family protein n=1 Tax=Micavibrio aeruginosavorus TaxID=349221 RepID=UPI003F4AE952
MTDMLTQQSDDQNPQEPKKGGFAKGALSAAFHMASGMALSVAVKCMVGATLAGAGGPVVAVATTAVAIGLLSTTASYLWQRMQAAPEDKASVKFSMKTFAMRTAFAGLGGAIGMMFGDSLCAAAEKICDGAKEMLGFGAVAPVVDVPVVADVPAVDVPVAVEPDCVDQVAKAALVMAQETDLTPCADEALRLAQAGSAQATKDLGLFFLSGYEGVPVDTAMAVDLLKQAATAGNEQAIQDLAYLEFHGKAGFVANPGEALKAMMTVDTATAREFVAQWTAMGVEVPADVVAPVVDTPVVETPVAEAPVAAAHVVEAVAPEAPQADVATAEVDCVDPVAKAAVIMAAEHDLTPCAEQSLKMAQAGNAQGVKDLAAFFLNGTDGLPKDPALGVELLKGAAEAGNVQAQVDLAYLQYHGLHGVEGGKDAALAAMQEIKSAAAREFVSAWTGQVVEGSSDMVLDISADARGNMVIDIDAGNEKVLSQSCTFSMAANGTGTVDCAIETKGGVKNIQAIIENCDKMFPSLKPAF